MSKYEFKMQQSSFVDIIITLKVIEMEVDRVRTIAELTKPTCHCNIIVFLGFANFCRHSISSFLHLAEPSTDTLKVG